MNSIDNAPRRPVVPVEKLFPAWACCCFLGSCYWSYPQCLGCYAQQVVGCCQSEQILCKTNDEHGVCCTTTKIECVCRRESTCFRVSRVKVILSPFFKHYSNLFSVYISTPVHGCSMWNSSFLAASLHLHYLLRHGKCLTARVLRRTNSTRIDAYFYLYAR